MMQLTKQLMILVAGPYRSGTLGEWFALPLIQAAGSKKIGDETFNGIFHPIALALIDHCDAVLRIGGASSGADEMVNTGIAKGKTIFYSKDDTPKINKLPPLPT